MILKTIDLNGHTALKTILDFTEYTASIRVFFSEIIGINSGELSKVDCKSIEVFNDYDPRFRIFYWYATDAPAPKKKEGVK